MPEDDVTRGFSKDNLMMELVGTCRDQHAWNSEVDWVEKLVGD